MYKKKILITGGNGFIGKNIRGLLNKKYEILSPGRNDLNLLDQKAVFEYLKLNCPEIIIHAATEGANRNNNLLPNILKNNLTSFYNLLSGSQYFNRMIVLGSGAEYDKRVPIIKAKESSFYENMPIDEYGFSKYIMSKYAQQVDYITHLRCFAVFGRHEDYQTRFISNVICKALLDLPITINQNVYFDYLYIDDVVKIIEIMIENKPRETFYNVGSGQRIDLLSIAKIVLEITGKDLPIEIKKVGLNNEYTCDISKLKNEFPDLDFTDLKSAISKMVEYYKLILPSIDKKLL